MYIMALPAIAEAAPPLRLWAAAAIPAAAPELLLPATAVRLPLLAVLPREDPLPGNSQGIPFRPALPADQSRNTI